MTHQYLDQLVAHMRHQHTAVSVEDIRVCLLLKNVQGLVPPLPLYPIRQDVVIVVDGVGVYADGVKGCEGLVEYPI